MKNNKWLAVLYIVLVLLIGTFFGYLVLQGKTIEMSAKKASEEISGDVYDETTGETAKPEETAEEESTEEEKTEGTDEEKKDEKEKAPKVFNNPFSFEKIKLGLDLAGGVSVVYEAVTDEVPSEEEMKSAIALLRTRLTFKGHTESEVSAQGDRRIRVEMPGIDNPQDAVKEIGQTAELKFYALDLTGLQLYPMQAPDGGQTQYLIFKQDETVEGGMTFYTGANIGDIAEFVVSGQNVKDAYKQYGQFSQTSGTEPYVALEFDEEGTRLFKDATERYLNKAIAIVLDDDIISVPSVHVVIADGFANITGMASDEEADSLANLIKSGSLPFKLTPIETSIIGARLGQDALNTSIQAGLIGFACVIVFMIIVYAFQGVVAGLSLSIYMILVMMALALFDVTLTLPGIAGIILSVGMAVDANVIIFTRIKEELKIGKTVTSAIRLGFEKGLSAIVDGNVTTLIIAAILYWKGIGAIRGFAQTLSIGIVLSMFTAIVITKFLMKLFVTLGVTKPVFYNVGKVKEEITTEDLNKKHVKKEKEEVKAKTVKTVTAKTKKKTK